MTNNYLLSNKSFLEMIFGPMVFSLIKLLNAMPMFVTSLKFYAKPNYLA